MYSMYLPKRDSRKAQIQQIKTKAHLQHMFFSWFYKKEHFRKHQRISHLYIKHFLIFQMYPKRYDVFERAKEVILAKD